jgi:hypothetical protein
MSGLTKVLSMIHKSQLLDIVLAFNVHSAVPGDTLLC